MFERYEDEKRAKRPGRLRRPAARCAAATCSTTRVRRRRSAGASATCSSTSSRTSTRSSRRCSRRGSATATDLCVVGDPEPGHLRVERRRRPATSRASPTATRGGEVVQLDRELPLVAPDPRRGQRRAGRSRAGRDGAGGPPRAAGAPGRRARSRPCSASCADDEGRGPRHRPGRARPPRPGRARGRAQAVLVRTNAQTALIEEALRQAGIPFRVRGGGAPARPARGQGRRSGRSGTRWRLQRRRAHRPRCGHRPTRRHHRRSTATPTARRRRHRPGASSTTTGRPTCATLVPPRPTTSRPSTAARTRRVRGVAHATTRAEQPDGSGDAVEIATFHAAKGLEWPVVHLAGLEQGLVPIGHAKDADGAGRGAAPVLRGHHPRRARAALHLGRAAHLRRARRRCASGRPTSTRSRRACRALARRRRPRRLAVVPRGPASDAARPHRSGRSAPAGGSHRAGVATARSAHDRSRTAAAADLDPIGLATFDALKAWRPTRPEPPRCRRT